MKPVFSKLYRKKPLFWMMWTAMLFITCIGLISFLAVRNMLTDITQKNMTTVLENSSHSREFAKLFADIDILNHTFLGKEQYSKTEGSRLTDLIERVIKNELNESHKRGSEQLLKDFKLFLEQCQAVNTVFIDRKTVHGEAQKMLESLEKLIGDLLVEKTLNDEDTTFVEQLLILSVGYQESLLETGKLFAELEPENLISHQYAETSPIIQTIDDLILRLQTITVSAPIIAKSCSEIIFQLKTYRQTLFEYFNAYAKLNFSRTALNKSQQDMLLIMGHLDDTMFKSTSILDKKIIQTIFVSSTLVWILTIVIVLLFYSIAFRLFKSMDIEISNRIAAEKSLGTLNVELEERVVVRTRELTKANALLEKKVSELKEAEKAIQENETFLNAIIENIPNMIFVKDARHLRFVRFNKAGEKLLGFSEADMLGKSDYDFFPPDQAAFFIRKDRKVLEDGILLDVPEEPIQTRRKGSRILHTKKIPINDQGGNPQYLLGISEDITERKEAVNKIKASLNEKEVLLKEIHHRVKNNMQVVSSLLSLQSEAIENPKILEALTETEVRVQSMALVHEILYQSNDLSQISLQKYLEAMTNHLIHIYATPARPVGIKINAENVILPIEQAVPCGLIVTELVTNSLKYGVTTDSILQIRIKADYEKGTHLTMGITDNGPGFSEDFDLTHIKTLGLKIVTGLITEQLEGSYSVKEDNGVNWVIHWPVA